MTVLRAFAQRISPRHRRWSRLLSSCTVDPDELPRPLDPIGERDVIVCGHSRSGTALVTAALWNPPSVVSVMEPWDAFRMPPAELFRSIREEITASGQLSRGRLDVHALERGEVRWQRDGGQTFPVALNDDTTLAVKMPAFWRYLELLPEARFVICLRDPVAVISSYERVGGRLSQGLDYDIAFNRSMNDQLQRTTDDLLRRRVAMFDYVATSMIPHLRRPNVLVVRYERWFEAPDAQLAALQEFVGQDLGPLRVKVRPAETEAPDQATLSTIRRQCSTAAALGYPFPERATGPGGFRP